MAYKSPALKYFEWQQPVIDKDLVDPPGGETKGDRYLIDGVGINAWAGEDGNIATYNGAGWDFTDKKEGMFVYVTDESELYLYVVAWAIFGGGNGAATFLGLTDTPGAYAGEAGKVVAVNATPDALEFVDTLTLAGLTVTNILFYDLTDYNFIFGAESGLNLTGGSAKTNVFIGYQCGKDVTTSNYNVAIGHQALFRNQEGSNNVAIGYRALYGTVGEHGDNNTALGYRALQSAYGAGNFGLGTDAGTAISSGTYNVCIGQSAGSGITTTHHNIAIGAFAMQQASGGFNVVIGPYAARLTTGAYNTCIGREAQRYATSANNQVCIGRMAGYFNVEGDENVFVGYQCGYGVTTKDYHDNVGIGAYALWSLDEQGNKNVAVGYRAGYSISTGASNVCIGYEAGKDQLTDGSNQLWIANTNTATPLIYGEFDNALLKIYNYLYLPGIRSGVDQAGAGASAGELWKTASHDTLPDNVVMIGI